MIATSSPASFGRNTLAPGTDEELAGPIVQPQPVKRQERISSIDVLRGVSLLGILVLNIDDFSNVMSMHDIPVGTAFDSFSGPHAHINLALMFLKWMFFEGKMRGIFSMLFGAGVILMTRRAEQRGAGAMVADTYLRRNMWLVLFGILHFVFIWHGDILFDYGLAGLLFLYPFRRVNPRTLLLLGTLMIPLATAGIFKYIGAFQDILLSHQVPPIEARIQQHLPLNPEDRATIAEWQTRVDHHKTDHAKVQKNIQEGLAGYWQQVSERFDVLTGPRFIIHVFIMSDTLSAMLIGMGLFQIGFLTAELSDSTYIWTAIIGFAISIPLYCFGLWHSYVHSFSFVTVEEWVYGPFYITRESGMLAVTAVVMLIVKHRLFRFPQRLLAAVGKTALSNYLLTSILCQFLCVWGPWKLFGRLEYYQSMYIVLAVWAFNLIASSIWLRHFEFGPFEWAWRSLTYWKRQPMLIRERI